ncbi:Enoyl-CoA hydratase/carnithine racemase [Rubrobacter radiotolerans]|uniref:Enoyl-CoA hydratase-related protein n=1 Tax=Rubrobacter radiotolerans TaxID=42256 RepID=A0A023X4G0_RUBRA|nr:enoyl-CoA hydratase-related protein [Rubrobacter radiotolerans]AHY46944.1 Enoyl-CoA hydratase/carnithine racemase [Rubrobacter radiotolerans]MDX5894349.1 enoyl-CoA hydratase-related protein [Rubrobacter radiotolerans]SMC05798.1 Enoyl-CoA hydratase/carnithine racemase [Rubrobacter radiotolerans DSM 5868]
MAVNYERDGRVGYITLDNPPANSYDYAFMEELGEAIRFAAKDGEAGAVILRSASERFFSAGADIKAFSRNSSEENMKMIELAHANLAQIAEIPKVFIAQVNSTALGGGLEMALACDLIFGAEGEYYLGLPEATLGLLPGNGGTQRLPRRIGVPGALDLMVTGRRVGPMDALRLNIFDYLFPAEELAERTREYADSLANGASEAIGAIKLSVNRGINEPLTRGLEIERELIAPLFDGAEAKEGISAFTEKRKPDYNNL